jgi:hypothetical protein
MKYFKILAIFISIFVYEQINAQTFQYVSYVHQVYSQNNKFFLKTTPYDNIVQTSTGKTTVYNADAIELYSIPRNFEIVKNRKEIFLSNNGQYIAYIIDKEFFWDDTLNKSIQYFENGKLKKSYSLNELISCDSDIEDCFLFYKDAIKTIIYDTSGIEYQYKDSATDFEKQLTKKATYFYDDTIYIFTKTKELVIFDLKSGDFIKKPMNSVNSRNFNQVDTLRIESEKFKPYTLYELPNLSIGKNFEESIANFLDMAVFPEDSKESDNFKQYALEIHIIVERSGKAELDMIENYDNLPEKKIKEFISSNLFETNDIPKGIEKWRFKGFVKLMNKNKEEAKKERQQELLEEKEAYKKRIVADTIDGFYIPKNLEECFLELNKLLKTKDIEEIKNLKSKEEMGMYHFGLGMWLRNNWSLWGGSRLQQYFIKKNIEHPDHMSGLILNYYYDWLNGEHDEWKEFEQK